jgi:GT2 family glycosyltransferase
MPQYDLSIVLPTCNRATLLERTLAAVWTGVACNYELIVVDGASDDATATVLADARSSFGDRLRVIREERRGGFTRATNLGFRAATGRNLTWINDDARPLPGSLDMAVQQIDSSPGDVGLLALFHDYAGVRNIAYQLTHLGRTYRLLHVRGTLYANFALGRRDTFRRVDYFDERFFFNGADPDLSLKIWNAGLRIVPAYGCVIDHDEVADARRAEDCGRTAYDNAAFFAKWDLPDRNPHRNDFNAQQPCTLRGVGRASPLDRRAA